MQSLSFIYIHNILVGIEPQAEQSSLKADPAQVLYVNFYCSSMISHLGETRGAA